MFKLHGLGEMCVVSVVPVVTAAARDGCLISRYGRVGEDIFVAMPEVEAEGRRSGKMKTAVAKVLHTIISSLQKMRLY